MSILAWLLLGLAAGFLGSRLAPGGGGGILGDIIVGIVGAVVGGALFNAVGETGVTGFNLWSLLVATVGAVVLLSVFYALRSFGTRGRSGRANR